MRIYRALSGFLHGHVLNELQELLDNPVLFSYFGRRSASFAGSDLMGSGRDSALRAWRLACHRQYEVPFIMTKPRYS